MENSDPLDTAEQAYVQHPQNNLVKARRLLLDVVQALHAQVEALVVIGAQAIYERTWHLPIDGLDLATADADFAVDPSLVVTAPQIETVMATSGFTHHPSRPGVWRYDDTGAGIDFLVPELFAGKGTRSAKVPGQAKNSIGRAAGLELALFDKSMMSIGSYEQGDPRTLRLKVAGSAALLCAKSFKLHERFSDHARPDRVRPKDATDVYRLFATSEPRAMAEIFLAAAEQAPFESTAKRGRAYLLAMFGPDGPGRRLISTELDHLNPLLRARELTDDWVSDFRAATLHMEDPSS